MKKTIIKTGVKILDYQSFFSRKMKVENKYLLKYPLCKEPLISKI